MQGLLYHYLKDFLDRRFGPPLWERVRLRAGVPESAFALHRQYPDRYLKDVVEAVRAELQPQAPSRDDLLFRFGLHVGANFRRDFPLYFDRFASARAMMAGIEPVIHAELRRGDPASRPPELRVLPLPSGRLRLVYSSPRRLCAVARGLVHSVAEAFGERALIEESRCLNRGDPACEMVLGFSGNESPRSDASPP